MDSVPHGEGHSLGRARVGPSKVLRPGQRSLLLEPKGDIGEEEDRQN